MSESLLRSALCCVLAIMIPAQMPASEPASAMLYASGYAWLNGSEVPKSAAIFAGDMVQTRSDSSANINAAGSSVMVLADSLVKFQGSAVDIDHGTVRIATSRGLEARAGDVTVKPAGNSWTEFMVSDTDGQMQITANKGDVTVQDQQGTTTTVSQGQTTTRDDTSEPKKKKRRSGGAAPAAGGGIMSSSKVIYGGLAVAGGITAWVLLQHEEPLSPACPGNGSSPSNSCP